MLLRKNCTAAKENNGYEVRTKIKCIDLEGKFR